MSAARGGKVEAVLQQALANIVDDSSLAPFIPASTFQGARPGYYFSRGKAGLGWVGCRSAAGGRWNEAAGVGGRASEAAGT